MSTESQRLELETQLADLKKKYERNEITEDIFYGQAGHLRFEAEGKEWWLDPDNATWYVAPTGTEEFEPFDPGQGSERDETEAESEPDWPETEEVRAPVEPEEGPPEAEATFAAASPPEEPAGDDLSSEPESPEEPVPVPEPPPQSAPDFTRPYSGPTPDDTPPVPLDDSTKEELEPDRTQSRPSWYVFAAIGIIVVAVIAVIVCGVGGILVTLRPKPSATPISGEMITPTVTLQPPATVTPAVNSSPTATPGATLTTVRSASSTLPAVPTTPLPSPTDTVSATFTASPSASSTPTATPTFASSPPSTSTPEPISSPSVTPTPAPPTATSTLAASLASPVAATDTPTPTLLFQGKLAYSEYDDSIKSFKIKVVNLATGKEIPGATIPYASQPALNREGTRLAYISWSSEKIGLYSKSLDDGTVNTISQFNYSQRPQWSYNGPAIVFEAIQEDRKDIQFSDAEGVPGIQKGQTPTWTPDGRLVLQACQGTTCGLAVVNTNGDNLQFLTSSTADISPSVAPDGNRIAYSSNKGGSWNVWLVNLKDKTDRQLTKLANRAGIPTWSPDGQWIAFVMENGEGWSVQAIRPDGTGRQKLVEIAGSLENRVSQEGYRQLSWLHESISWSR